MKFIVVPDELLDHFFYYVKNLRSLIYSGTAKKALVTSGDGKQMLQTNVASSLTAAFNKANVFNSGEYQRVSCTRIRCGLATFACNEVKEYEGVLDEYEAFRPTDSFYGKSIEV